MKQKAALTTIITQQLRIKLWKMQIKPRRTSKTKVWWDHREKSSCVYIPALLSGGVWAETWARPTQTLTGERVSGEDRALTRVWRDYTTRALKKHEQQRHKPSAGSDSLDFRRKQSSTAALNAWRGSRTPASSARHKYDKIHLFKWHGR